jgi:SAM-dependent methyltransferase
VAQALHWFDRPAFFAEAARVLRPDGVLAVWSYGPLRVASEAVQGVMARFYHEVVGPYWPPERRLVDAGYRDVVLPFEEMAAPGFSMEAALTLEQLAGYAGTWSATQAFEKARGEDPTEALRRALAGVWGDHETTRVVRWPLALRVARKERAG